jgi:hypothetical protein
MNQPIETMKARRQRLIVERGQRLSAELLAFAAASRQRLDEIDREFPPDEPIAALSPAPTPQRPPEGAVAEWELAAA